MFVAGQVGIDNFQLGFFHMFLENLPNSLVHNLAKNLKLVDGFLTERVEINFSGGGSVKIVQVRHAGHCLGLAQNVGSAPGIGDHGFVIGDGKAGGHAGLLVHIGTLAGLNGDLLDNLSHEIRHDDFDIVVFRHPGFLMNNLNAQFAGQGIVGADFGPDAVLQLGDDFSGPGVFLRVGGEEQNQIQIEPDGITAHLNVPFFQNIKEGDLHQIFQIGKFVHREDAAVHAGDKAEVDGFLAGQGVSRRHFGGVQVSYKIGNLGAGGQAFAVTAFPADPLNFQLVALGRQFFSAGGADGVIRIVVNFTALHDG